MGVKFDFEIIRHCGTLGECGYKSTELNLISYAGEPPKYDLRRWLTINGERKMGKGLTLTGDELHVLREILNGMDGV